MNWTKNALKNGLIEAVQKQESIKHNKALTKEQREEYRLFWWLAENYFLEKLELLEPWQIKSLDDMDATFNDGVPWREHVEQQLALDDANVA